MIREVGLQIFYERWKEQDIGGPQTMFLRPSCREKLVSWVNRYGK